MTTVYRNQGSSALATQPQKDRIITMRIERGLKPLPNMNQLTRSEASKMIDELMKTRPTTEPMRQLFIDLYTRIQEAGHPKLVGKAIPTHESLIKKYDGDKLSALIDKYRQVERTLGDFLPPSDIQLEQLADMQYLPDVPFEALNVVSGVVRGVDGSGYTETKCVNRRVYLFEDDDMLIPKMTEKGVQQWRWMSRGEFIAELKAKLTRDEASRIISQYRGTYMSHQRNKITDYQKQQIRQMEQRLASQVVTTRTFEQVTTITGDLDEDILLPSRSATQMDMYGGESYDDHQLDMLSRREADILLNWMRFEQSEAGRASYSTLSREEYEAMDIQQDFEEARKLKESAVAEYNDLNDMLYALQVIAGYDVEEFQDEATNILLDVKSKNGETFGQAFERKQRFMEKVQEFMQMLIREEYMTFTQLAELLDKNELAQNIFVGKY